MKLKPHQTIHDFENKREALFRIYQTRRARRQAFFRETGWMWLAACVFLALLAPALTVVLFFVFLCCFFLTYFARQKKLWLLREPLQPLAVGPALATDINKPATASQTGILYLGQAISHQGSALWFSQADLVTHMLLLGTTGSGKSQLLFAMMYQFAAMGSGFIYVDGKADMTTWFYLYSMMHQLGLEDQLLVINFLIPGQSGNRQQNKTSHTFNPFAEGASDVLMEIMSGLMGSSSHDSSMWRGRAEALGRCLLRALCELRDVGEFTLNIDVIRDYLPLEQLEKLSEHPKLSAFAKANIQYYLSELPAWSTYKSSVEKTSEAAQIAASDAKKTAFEQHGFLTMQFTKTLELLSGAYAHITKTDLAEVDFKDVMVNRRCLYIMLPSLEKSPETLKDLGRMVVTNIRNALAGLLGAGSLTGEKRFLLDAKPTHASIPYGLFFDEYGSYAVDGFGDIGAQARSLNISVCFSGQEFDSFKKGSAIEASRILSNTGIKIFMKTESDTTTQIAQERAGDTYVYAPSHLKRNEATWSSDHVKGDDFGLQKVKVITKQDLVDQKPGECHVFFGKHLWRVQAFYGDFHLSAKTSLNEFIKLKLKNESPVYSLSAVDISQVATPEDTHPSHMSENLIAFLKNQKQETGDANI